MQSGKIVSINRSEKTGLAKKPVKSAVFDQNGIIGDAHAGFQHRQVSILGWENIDRFNQENDLHAKPGDFAENLTTEGIDLKKVNLLDRLQIGKVILEITQRGKKCHNAECSIREATGYCVMPKEGIFARVVKRGVVKTNDLVFHEQHCWRILIITLSDRAFHGVYTDRSGLKAKELIKDFFAQTLWRWQIDDLLLPDDAKLLQKNLQRAVREKCDIIFTLGGTGLGPRDFASEIVAKLCDKIIPGIMENIRNKYGCIKPNALLSRSIAGIAKQTQIYALPGSVHAVREYLDEILPLLEHATYMLYGLDVH